MARPLDLGIIEGGGNLMRSISYALLVCLTFIFASCSGKPGSDDAAHVAAPQIPMDTGPEVDAASPPPTVELSNGAQIALPKIADKIYFEVEGTFTDEAFARFQSANSDLSSSEKRQRLRKEIEGIRQNLRTANAMGFSMVEEVAYFKFYIPYEPTLLAPLKKISFRQSLVLNPVTIDQESLARIRSLSPGANGLPAPTRDPRGATEQFSGLKRMKALQFVKLAEQEIGGDVRVNGDTSRIGITDTGITLGHPAFLARNKSASGKRESRIAYLKDFTREGRVYFNLNAQFQAAPAASGNENELMIQAQLIATPPLPLLPPGDHLSQSPQFKIQVSPELRARLLDPTQTPKLGVLSEASMEAADEKIDLNGNGRVDDALLVILFPGKSAQEDVLYLDTSGMGDFRKSRPVGDWNQTKQTVTAFAEIYGFQIQDDTLPTADGKGEVVVRSASVVGFDPGNHGTHVAGIAAGLKTLANDPDDTLARGVAPNAAILMNRICRNNGGCGGTEAFVDLALNSGAHVINMSLGGVSPYNDGYGVMDLMINRLSALRNVLFVVSAGNNGPGHQTVASPSTARNALSVGASATVGMIQRQYQYPGSPQNEDEDFLLFFSGRGPSAAGGFKPNLVAPGTELSAVRLNTAPGSRGGLDVYWGTSMSAPATAGAYALLLDAIHKYNVRNPKKKLTENALTLRRVLIETAKPFNASRFDPVSGEFREGKYTWADQGTGMLDLVAAWKKLFELRDQSPETAVEIEGEPVELEYEALTSQINPGNISYEGDPSGGADSDPNRATDPRFGTGIYLDYRSKDSLFGVAIKRRLPESLASSAAAGDLTRQLLTTADEFVLKTVIYGSNLTWLRAGVLNQLDCNAPDAEVSDRLMVIGRGVEFQDVNDQGKKALNPLAASALQICVDRKMLTEQLPAGEHGALIAAYRVSRGKVASVPSFWVPVYAQVPHKTLEGSTAYLVNSTVKSFEVARNAVLVPPGTNRVYITLEVPVKDDKTPCSGVELMALLGNNNANPFKARKDARVRNCEASGAPVVNDANRKLQFSISRPTPGIWDLHILGFYPFQESSYRLRVDYLAASTSVSKIEGGEEALSGSFTWNIQSDSIKIGPDARYSSMEINSLEAKSQAQVSLGQSVFVAGPLGIPRSYPEDSKSVTIRTGGSPGNDLDIAVLGCNPPSSSEAFDPAQCEEVSTSGGPTDEEEATFVPIPGKVYLVRVDGYSVRNEGNFTSSEQIRLKEERGTLSISGSSPRYVIEYSFPEAQRSKSRLLQQGLFRNGTYAITGELTLKSEEGIALSVTPIQIQAKRQ